MIESVVILSTADFNAAVWTNKPHLAIRLAEHREVIYIESLGLRRPNFSKADVKRIASRLFRKPAQNGTPKRVRIIKPLVIPFHGNKLVQLFNGALLRKQIRLLLQDSNKSAALWTFSPVTYGIERYFDMVVYHSVDLLHTQPRVPTSLLLKAEKQMAGNADVLIASSTGVANHLRQATGRDVQVWENVADTALYTKPKNLERKPAVVFAGNLTTTKIDFGLLMALADAGLETILAGPTAIDGTSADADLGELLNHPGISHVGNLEPRRLAELLNSCTVGVIPYVLNDYTAGVFPMKVYEYLASGLAVVSTQLPSLQHMADQDIHVVPRENFVHTVTQTLTADRETVECRKERASAHSWENRTKSALSILDSRPDNVETNSVSASDL